MNDLSGAIDDERARNALLTSSLHPLIFDEGVVLLLRGHGVAHGRALLLDELLDKVNGLIAHANDF